MFPMTDRRLYIAYFLILAVGVAVWWAVILGSAEIRQRFFSDSFGKGEYYVFLIPDLLVIIVGSAMVCWFAVVKSWQPMSFLVCNRCDELCHAVDLQSLQPSTTLHTGRRIDHGSGNSRLFLDGAPGRSL